MKLVRFGLYLLIFTIPLIPAGFGFGYEEVKVLFFYILLTTILGITFYLSLKNQFTLKISNKIKFFLATVFFLSLGLTSFLGVDLQRSFFGAQPYLQGVFFYFFLLLFYLLAENAYLKLDSVAKVVVSSGALVSLFALIQWIALSLFNFSIATYAGRVGGSFGQPNFYSGFLVLTLPFSYHLFVKDKKHKSTWGYIAAISLLAIFISESRTAILLSLGLLVVWLLSALRRLRIFIISLAVLVVASSIFLAYKFQSGIVLKELFEPRDQLWLIHNSPERRILIWPILIEQGVKKYFIGYGLENISKAFSSYPRRLTNSPVFYTLQNLKVDRAHNYILDLFLQAGAVGLFFWLCLVVYLLVKSKSAPLRACLVLYLIWSQLQNQSGVHLIFFWLMVGLV